MWGRSPHAPAGSAHAAWPSRAQRTPDGVRPPRPEGERAFPPLWGLRPHAPSRRSLRCTRLWPTHPPSDLLHVGAAPPRPIPDEPALRAALAHPPALGFSSCGGGAPTPPPDQGTRRGLRGRNVLSRAFRLPRPEGEGAFPPLWGLRPHAPSRRSVRCAPLWPTHPPSDVFSVGAEPPRPRRIRARGVALAGATCFRGRSGSLAPRVRVGVRAFRRPPGEKAPRAHRTSGGAPRPPQRGSTGAPSGSLGSTGPSPPGEKQSGQWRAARSARSSESESAPRLRGRARPRLRGVHAGGVGGAAPHREKQSGAGGWAERRAAHAPPRPESAASCEGGEPSRGRP